MSKFNFLSSPQKWIYLSYFGIFLILFTLGLFHFDNKIRRGQQAQGRSILKTLIKNQDQQFKTYGKFTPNLENLYRGTSKGIGTYKFKMTVESDQVFFEAIPIIWRRVSYSGALFKIKTDNSIVLVGGICKSPSSSMTAPIPIQPPFPNFHQVRCPLDAELVESMKFSK
ncbi:hypothetical protein PL11201_190024 [Planktothrix sp. PCC 11201]|uniref:type IV pilin-like G/H family protein n=1 Tax=Planktothrix sp. PCC 11201 TaxID=1729650 RepID=UPI000913C757|nr:type IV pilin-like G/H family protein [Planktothrix sp. PCC 11201]SKB11838.1 hypothetical protein PL11201_190024 [Planktothrix sp. PCC 11201]